MPKVLFRILTPILIAGLFVIIAFVALEYDTLQPSSYFVLFLTAFFTFSFGFATGQKFASPIEELLEKAKQIRSGNFSQRAYIETKDELAELARVINEIAETLETNENELAKNEQFIDISVRAKTKDLQETITNLENKVKNRTFELEKMMGEITNLKETIKDQESELAQAQLKSISEKPAKTKTAVSNDETAESDEE